MPPTFAILESGNYRSCARKILSRFSTILVEEALFVFLFHYIVNYPKNTAVSTFIIHSKLLERCRDVYLEHFV